MIDIFTIVAFSNALYYNLFYPSLKKRSQILRSNEQSVLPRGHIYTNQKDDFFTIFKTCRS